MNLANYFFCLLFIFFIGCSKPSPEPTRLNLFLAQGVMVGEISHESAILQTRTTAVPRLTDGHVPGTTAFVRFLYGTDYKAEKTWQKTPWRQSGAAQDFIIKNKISNLNAGTDFSRLWMKKEVPCIGMKKSLNNSGLSGFSKPDRPNQV